MARTPVFSIILPTFNREKLLPRAIKSVLYQIFKNFELIIIDDASTDNTAKVVKQFSDPRIRYYFHTKNMGVSSARNYGIRLAKGQYISFIDDDDEYLPGFLEKTFHQLLCVPQSVGFTWTGLHHIESKLNGKKRVSEKHWLPEPHHPKDRYRTFLHSMYLGTGWGLTIRRQCFDHIGLFDESFKAGEDTEFILRLCESFEGLAISDSLVKVHSHFAPHLLSSKLQTAEIYNKILQKHQQMFLFDSELRSYFQYKVGWWYYFTNNRRKGRKYLKKSLNAEPLNVKKWLVFFYLELFGSGGIFFQRQLSKKMHTIFRINSDKRL